MKQTIRLFDETICMKASKSQIYEFMQHVKMFYVKACLFPDQ